MRKTEMRGSEKLAPHVLDKVMSGDLLAFEALYHEHKRAVYALCLRGTKDTADAEDLTQEVFLKVHRKVKDLREKAYFKSWLYRVTMNTVLMHLRKRPVEPIPLQFFVDRETAPVVNALQTRTVPRFGPIGRIALTRAIGGLPERRRRVVVLHDIKGMSHSEIATSMGVPLNTTKSHLWRAHRQLRAFLIAGSPPFVNAGT
jgi:RNA polymerase sigma-70 factor (ECF subfamily)